MIESVIRGPGGLLEHGRAGQVIVDLSTADPASTRALHDELAERGVRYLDAGISGGAPCDPCASMEAGPHLAFTLPKAKVVFSSPLSRQVMYPGCRSASTPRAQAATRSPPPSRLRARAPT